MYFSFTYTHEIFLSKDDEYMMRSEVFGQPYLSVILPPPHYIFKDISHDTATLHQPHRQHGSSEHRLACAGPSPTTLIASSLLIMWYKARHVNSRVVGHLQNEVKYRQQTSVILGCKLLRTDLRMLFKFQLINSIWIEVANRMQNCNFISIIF